MDGSSTSTLGQWRLGVTEGAGNRNNFIGRVFKYGVFDIKATYSHLISFEMSNYT